MALFASAKVPTRLMLACYPGSGGRYVAHLDNDPSDPAYGVGPVGLRACDRVFTCILYLNDAWEAPHEGCLRMFTRSSEPELDSGATIERWHGIPNPDPDPDPGPTPSLAYQVARRDG